MAIGKRFSVFMQYVADEIMEQLRNIASENEWEPCEFHSCVVSGSIIQAVVSH